MFHNFSYVILVVLCEVIYRMSPYVESDYQVFLDTYGQLTWVQAKAWDRPLHNDTLRGYPKS